MHCFWFLIFKASSTWDIHTGTTRATDKWTPLIFFIARSFLIRDWGFVQLKLPPWYMASVSGPMFFSNKNVYSNYFAWIISFISDKMNMHSNPHDIQRQSTLRCPQYFNGYHTTSNLKELRLHKEHTLGTIVIFDYFPMSNKNIILWNLKAAHEQPTMEWQWNTTYR